MKRDLFVEIAEGFQALAKAREGASRPASTTHVARRDEPQPEPSVRAVEAATGAVGSSGEGVKPGRS